MDTFKRKLPLSLNIEVKDTQHTVNYELATNQDFQRIYEIGFEQWKEHMGLRMQTLKQQMNHYNTGVWVAKIEGKVVGYTISCPYIIEELPLEEDFKQSLSEEEKKKLIYLIHDTVVDAEFRGQGIHKIFHKLTVEEAIKNNLTEIFGVAMHTDFRKSGKKYRFIDYAKARFHEKDSMIVRRDLKLEELP